MSESELFRSMPKGLDLAQAMAESDRCLLCHDAPCSKGCPAQTDPGAFIRKLRMRNVTGAIRTIKTNNALGGACGVLCPAGRLCEKECSATGIGRPIRIADIQRSLIEHSWKIGFSAFEAPTPRAQRVAVIGSGPAGLSCAAELARDGFAVTVFEARPQPGGVIRYGVPACRFDADFLSHELADLAVMGIRFVCSTRLDGPGAKKLLADGYSAVFLAPGLWGAERLDGGRSIDGVCTSVELLALLREDRFDEISPKVKDKTVAVIGGGSVAMDCVESLMRLGARDAYIVYRRSFAQMPAEEGERVAALRMGAHLLALNQPVAYAADDKGRLTGIRLVRTRLGAPDPSGRRAPERIEGTDWTLEVQLAVEAIGNRSDGTDWSVLVAADRNGLIPADEKTRRTSAASVFAGGDIVRGPALVVEAVQDGKLAARAIHEALV